MIVMIWSILCAVNVVGVRSGIKALWVFTVLKFVPLLLLLSTGIARAFRHFGDIQVPPPMGTGLSGWGPPVLLVMYAFIAFEGALIPAGETRDPGRSIPRAIILTLLGSTVFYFLLQAICVLNDPALARSKAPLAEVAGVFFGPDGSRTMALAVVASILGNLSAGALALPRIFYSMGECGELPEAFARIHRKFRTPWVAILVSGTCISTLACSGNFVFLAGMAVLVKFVLYAISIASLPRFAGKRALLGLPCLGLACCAGVIAQAKPEAWAALGLTLLFGTLTQGLMRIRSAASYAPGF